MTPFDQIPKTDSKREVAPHKMARPVMERLGYWGLVPFGFGVIIFWLSPWLVSLSVGSTIARGTISYAGIIAAFMAGMSTGNVLAHERAGISAYLPTMIASLVAWLTILPNGYFFITMGEIWRIIILVIVFIWLYLNDVRLTQQGAWKSWYTNLRLRLSAWVILALSAIAARFLLIGVV